MYNLNYHWKACMFFNDHKRLGGFLLTDFTKMLWRFFFADKTRKLSKIPLLILSMSIFNVDDVLKRNLSHQNELGTNQRGHTFARYIMQKWLIVASNMGIRSKSNGFTVSRALFSKQEFICARIEKDFLNLFWRWAIEWNFLPN